MVVFVLVGGVITEAKNVSMVVSITPSATPVALSKVRRRPLTATTNWLGPTVPIVSGGKAPVSARVAPVKVVLRLVRAVLVATAGDGGTASRWEGQ